jgi:hypothetical protein
VRGSNPCDAAAHAIHAKLACMLTSNGALLIAQACASSSAPESAAPPSLRPQDAVSRVNKAILLYREQRYLEMDQLLSPYLPHLDALDEGVALHLCLLLLDVHLNQVSVKVRLILHVSDPAQ